MDLDAGEEKPWYYSLLRVKGSFLHESRKRDLFFFRETLIVFFVHL